MDGLIEEKFYCKESNRFIYRRLYSEDEIEEEKFFKTFEEFSNFLNGDLSGTELSDYNFKGIDLKKFNFRDANICSTVLIEQGLYDDSFYKQNVESVSDEYSILPPDCQELIVKYDNILPEPDKPVFSLDSIIYYVTDLHLDHKIKKKFPSHASENEIRKYLKELSGGIREDFHERSLYSHYKFLLIGGDVSYNPIISKIFYEELVKVISPEDIITILGNHELWSFQTECEETQESNASFKEIISNYRNMFNELGITFLQNELLIFNWNDKEQLSEIDLEEMSDDLKESIASSPLSILGGIGFSGYNESFNAKNGIYRNTLDRDEEVIQTKIFERLYDKMECMFSDFPLIVLTHMPKKDWSLKPYNKNWIYINGHTHRNSCEINPETTVYSDNQVGYSNTAIRLKHFSSAREYDPFRYYESGIYEISRDQYINFNRGLNIGMNFNRKNCVIHMLKNNGAYCFLLEKCENGKLFLLNGGQIKTIEHQDLQYYHSNLKLYADSVNYFMGDYNKSLEKLSEAVKAIGGEGSIHGCIVDIDFFNHAYLNPLDGKITPYHALNMAEKWIYKNVLSLLAVKRVDLYEKYKSLKSSDMKTNVLTIMENTDFEIVTESEYYPNTDIYRISRIIKGLQYTTNYNVVRTWDDKMFELDNVEMGRLIVNSLLESGK